MVAAIDVVIIIGYLALMLVVVYISGKKNTTQDDYFLAGRSMPWIPIALSVAATKISANGFIGGPGWAYTSGMFPVMVNIAVPFAVLFALSVTTPVIYRMKVTSVYQYMEKRLGKYSRALTIVDSLLNSMTAVFTKDVYEPLFHKKKEASLKVTMLISIVIGIIMIGVIFVGFNGTVKSVLDVVGNYISYFAGPAFGAFLLAMFTYRANDKGVAGGFITGRAAGYVIAVKFQVSWLWNPFIGATITIIAGYLLSIVVRDKCV